jgi:hypothetical protein
MKKQKGRMTRTAFSIAKYQSVYDVIPVETGIQRACRLDSRSWSGMTAKESEKRGMH